MKTIYESFEDYALNLSSSKSNMNLNSNNHNSSYISSSSVHNKSYIAYPNNNNNTDHNNYNAKHQQQIKQQFQHQSQHPPKLQLLQQQQAPQTKQQQFMKKSLSHNNNNEESLYAETNINSNNKSSNKNYIGTPATNKANSGNSTQKEIMMQINIDFVLSFIRYLLKKFDDELKFLMSNGNEIMNLMNSNITSIPPTTTTESTISMGTCNMYHKELNEIKYILNFDCFTLFNKKNDPNYQKPEKIISRVQKLLDTLQQMETILQSENLNRALIFYNESECVKIFMKIFPKELFKKEYFRKISSELWKYVRNNKNNMSYNHQQANLQITFERLKLFMYGIAFPSPYIEDYPLHKAIFESNLSLIRRLIANEDNSVFYCHIEESDLIGTTPLMLAVRLCKKDAVLILVENGADPKHRICPYARTALEEAVQKKHRSIVRTLLATDWHLKQVSWETNKLQILNYMKTIPDFTFDMNWECDSNIIPFINRYAPSDKYKIYKRGKNLRIDMTLIGLSKTKCTRGNYSIILRGDGENAGKLLMVDHNEKKVTNLLAEIDVSTLENQVDDLIKQKSLSSEMKAENVDFKPAENWRGEKIIQKIEEYTTVKYNAKGTFSILYTKRDVLLAIDTTKFKNFEEYFEYTYKNPLWIFDEDEGNMTNSNSTITTIMVTTTGNSSSNANNIKISPIFNLMNYLDNHQDITTSILENNHNTSKDLMATLDRSNESLLLSPSLSSSVLINDKFKEKLDKLNNKEKRLCKYYTKNIIACIWLCENFPITFEHLLPILDILSNTSLHIINLKSFLSRKSLLKLKSFPIKAVIPLFYSLNAIIEFKNFNFRTPSEEYFEIDKNHILYEHNYQDMMNYKHLQYDDHHGNTQKTKSNNARNDIDNNHSKSSNAAYDLVKKKKRHKNSSLNKAVNQKTIMDAYSNSNYTNNTKPAQFKGDNILLQNLDDIEDQTEQTQKLFESFFKRRSRNSINKDFVNIFEEDNDSNNNDDDDDQHDNNDHSLDNSDHNLETDLAEKYRFESLKVNNHQTTQPKTIKYIMNKYSSVPNQYVIPPQSRSLSPIYNRSHIQATDNNNTNHNNITYDNAYGLDFKQTLINLHYGIGGGIDYGSFLLLAPPQSHVTSITTATTATTTTTTIMPNKYFSSKTSTEQISPKKEDNSVIIDPDYSILHEINLTDNHMNKLMRYNLKKHTLLSKEDLNFKLEDIKQEYLYEHIRQEPKEFKTSQKGNIVKHERIRSLDDLHKPNNKHNVKKHKNEGLPYEKGIFLGMNKY